jgi:putative DNA primase/helicase
MAWALLEKSDPLRDKRTGLIIREGKPRGTLPNVQIVFQYDPTWACRFQYCELRQRILIDGRIVEDADEAEIALQLSRVYGLGTSTQIIHEAIGWAAARNRVHPVRAWLDELEWDGVPRLERWLIDYCSAADTPLYRAMGRAWMVQAVARAMEPGCKADAVLILQGVQGCRKSTTCRVLGGEWFRDSDIDLGSKDRYAALEGAWIYELGELDAMRRADARALKAFVSSQVDSYRPAYGRNTRDVPRCTVFVGTTNDHEFLVDATGSRRYLVVEVGQCHPERLEEDREQLWAEAAELYRQGVPWHLDAEAEAARTEQAETFAPVDSWESEIGAWTSRQSEPFTLAAVWSQALGHERIDASKPDDMRMATILRRLGFTKRRASTGRREVLWHLDRSCVGASRL